MTRRGAIADSEGGYRPPSDDRRAAFAALLSASPQTQTNNRIAPAKPALESG
jgi:hypothetical protein